MRALVTVKLAEEEKVIVAGVRHAAPLLERLAAQVDLLYVAPPLPPLDLDVRSSELGLLLDAAVEREDERSRQRLRALFPLLPASLRREVAVTRSSEPSHEIVARARSYDLVVLSTHARRGITRLWLGSVAELVVRTSPVSVLVLPSTREAPGMQGRPPVRGPRARRATPHLAPLRHPQRRRSVDRSPGRRRRPPRRPGRAHRLTPAT